MAAAETNARRKKSIRKFNQEVNQTFELKSASFEFRSTFVQRPLETVIDARGSN